jgi:predicted SprT family Zn-dependent metalloprotease
MKRRSSTPETRKKQEKKMQTPPLSPSKISLPSPSKATQRIPPSPHRDSSDAFWSQEMTNEWNDQWSPPKQNTKSRALERLLAALGEESTEAEANEAYTDADRRGSTTATKAISVSSPTKSPSKTALKRAETAQRKEAAARKKAFDDKKATFAQDFLTALDEVTSGGQVRKLAETTGGIKITWSKTLRSTAGRAKWKQERLKQPGAEIKYLHHASIELAEHVIDDENRLLNTLAHEYCHLANYMISGIRNQPHGSSFKQWGRKCVEAIRTHAEYKNYPIEVTTKHSYEIDYKYLWLCIDCGHKYGRHSKSIDPSKARCSLCKGGLQQVKPKPRKPASPQKKNFFSNANSGNVLSEVALDTVVESLGNANLG